MAGGYAIRPGRDPLVEKISGSFTNVVGLPMEVVLPILRKLGLTRRT
jgi:predicted house-cleaning NTP pyrophosphatase (Maf/HAM1 superfamily)